MMPKFEDGQIVWVRRAETLRSGEEGLFVLNGNGFIKLYREQPTPADSPETVRNRPVLYSYNSAYEPITVGMEDSFRICGKILSL
jgi:repressor LexA